MCLTEIPTHACNHPALPPSIPVVTQCNDSFFNVCPGMTVERRQLFPPVLCFECQLAMMAWTKIAIRTPINTNVDEEECDAALSSEEDPEDTALSTKDEITVAMPKWAKKAVKRVPSLSPFPSTFSVEVPIRSKKVKKPAKRVRFSSPFPDSEADSPIAEKPRKKRKMPLRNASVGVRYSSPSSDSETASQAEYTPAPANEGSRHRTMPNLRSNLPNYQIAKPISTLTHLGPIKDIRAFINRSIAERQTEKPENRIPRPQNPFILYRSTFSARAKAFCRESNHQVLSKVLGASWAMESDQVKRKFSELAELEKVQHSLAFPGYKFTHAGPKKKKLCKSFLADGE